MNIDGVIEKLKCATRCHPNVIETLINEAIEMLEAEREAVMRQAPRIWRRYAGVIAGSPCFAYREQEPMQDDGFEWVAFYASPLPAQQIPEGYVPHYLTGSYKTRSSNSLVGVIHAVRKCNGDNFNYSLCGKKPRPKSMGWHETRSEITCDKCKAMLSASQPKGDV